MVILTGIVYPLLVTGIANLGMTTRAKGSLVFLNHKLVGSTLIGQKFESDRYFWPRPSAVDYATLPSGGSNLAPTSKELKELVEKRRAHLEKEPRSQAIPSDLLYASGSGLDPHISEECAYFQIERVAQARHMESQKIRELVESLTRKRRFGFLGARYVNVLDLNLALDAEEKKS